MYQRQLEFDPEADTERKILFALAKLQETVDDLEYQVNDIDNRLIGFETDEDLRINAFQEQLNTIDRKVKTSNRKITRLTQVVRSTIKAPTSPRARLQKPRRRPVPESVIICERCSHQVWSDRTDIRIGDLADIGVGSCPRCGRNQWEILSGSLTGAAWN